MSALVNYEVSLKIHVNCCKILVILPWALLSLDSVIGIIQSQFIKN